MQNLTISDLSALKELCILKAKYWEGHIAAANSEVDKDFTTKVVSYYQEKKEEIEDILAEKLEQYFPDDISNAVSINSSNMPPLKPNDVIRFTQLGNQTKLINTSEFYRVVSFRYLFRISSGQEDKTASYVKFEISKGKYREVKCSKGQYEYVKLN